MSTEARRLGVSTGYVDLQVARCITHRLAEVVVRFHQGSFSMPGVYKDSMRTPPHTQRHTPTQPTQTQAHAHVCVHACTRARTRTHSHAHAHARARMHARKHTCVHARTQPHTHARSHACMHACMPAHTPFGRNPALQCSVLVLPREWLGRWQPHPTPKNMFISQTGWCSAALLFTEISGPACSCLWYHLSPRSPRPMFCNTWRSRLRYRLPQRSGAASHSATFFAIHGGPNSGTASPGTAPATLLSLLDCW